MNRRNIAHGIVPKGLYNKPLLMKIIEHYDSVPLFADMIGVTPKFVWNVMRRRRRLNKRQQIVWAAMLRSDPEKLWNADEVDSAERFPVRTVIGIIHV